MTNLYKTEGICRNPYSSNKFIGFPGDINNNQLRRDLVQPEPPPNLKHLAKDVPSGADILFGDEINKRISQLSATNSALQKPKNRGYSSYNKYDHKSCKQKCKSSKNFHPISPSTTDTLHRGARATAGRATITGTEIRCTWLLQGKKYTKLCGIVEENHLTESLLTFSGMGSKLALNLNP